MSGINQYYYLEKKRRGRSVANEAPLSEILYAFLKKCHIDYNPYEDEVIAAFKELCGPTIANFITEIRMQGQVLYVRVSLPAVRAELMMVRDAMRDTINRKLRKNTLKRITVK